jgi:hypothetical protein
MVVIGGLHVKNLAGTNPQTGTCLPVFSSILISKVSVQKGINSRNLGWIDEKTALRSELSVARLHGITGKAKNGKEE